MLNIYVIGCGGIGGFLIDLIPMMLSSASLDIVSRYASIDNYLGNAGNVAVPCVADSLTFIDADTFNARNALRQGAGSGGKLETRMRRFRDDILTCTWLQNLRFCGYAAYVTPENMQTIIPVNPPVNQANLDAWRALFKDSPSGVPYANNATVVLLCVDNAKTRYEVSKYCEAFDNVLVVNGGNDRTTGHATIYQRENGVALDPNIMDIYPNIRPDVDKRPDEVECGTVAPAHDQIAITNYFIAGAMAEVLLRFIKQPSLNHLVRGRVQRRNEILIDIDRYSMSGVSHPLTN